MSQTPNYLEQLNQGRKRRSSTSIEELNRTLAELEDRVGMMSARGDWYPPRGREPQQMPGAGGFNPYRNMADDLERTRRQEEDLALLSQIANEMQEMRAELRTELHRPAPKDNAELIEALRSDMERLAGAVADMAG
jgi:localization factor PodJL